MEMQVKNMGGAGSHPTNPLGLVTYTWRLGRLWEPSFEAGEGLAGAGGGWRRWGQRRRRRRPLTATAAPKGGERVCSVVLE